ncbi:sensor histidine kinase [Angustibacter luteus]|uniref:Sensor-like histidine kinase SenX3 n=1 Tax=Angustibacter luteus TaxID=658456 RepID=A0ABW1JIJ2_9ACTN
MSSRATDPDEALLRRAARTVAVQTAAAVALVVLVMAGSVLLLDERQQHRQADQSARSAWATADDVRDPPAGTWLIALGTGGEREVTAGAPDGLDDLDPASLPDGVTRLERDDRELVVWTGQRDIGRVSAVYDLTPRESEERRLLASLGIAALVGVLGAAAVGAIIGRRAVKPLAEALALQRRFVADASHELRTPTTVLFTRAQLLRRHLRGVVPEERVGEVDRLVDDARNLGGVVNDLLLSAELDHRPQGGEDVDVAALAVDVTTSLQALADPRGIGLTVHVGREPAVVRGAEAALRRALTSLLDNAIAHSDDGGRVVVDVAVDAAAVRLSVADAGDGIDPREAHRLLARFSRGTTGDAGRRFGLGLSLVAEVARAHGGTLLVEGEPGQGATLTLRLPRAPRPAL